MKPATLMSLSCHCLCTRYWYVSLVACTLKHSKRVCEWTYQKPQMTLKYDLWFVNGDPSVSHSNIFEHQFSIEQFDMFEIHLGFLFLHLLVTPLQCYAVHLHRHPVAVLLLVCMLIEVAALASSLSHYARFAVNGIGFEWFQHFGKFLDLIAQSCFMLLLLLVVKGLSITCSKLPCLSTIAVLAIWILYTAANVILFFWNMVRCLC